MELTQDQKDAIRLRDRTLLVSAAAGSGKTSTLTRRVIKSIIEDKIDLSKLLIVTFTRASANDLKEKISVALVKAIESDPDNTNLQSQLVKLGNAHISTIDSFFTEPVMSNFEKLGLPASLRFADAAELSGVRDKILSDAIESIFDTYDTYGNKQLSPVGDEDYYTALIGVIYDARDSSKLLPTFWDIYKKLITSPEGVDQLITHAKRLRNNASLPYFETLEGQTARKALILEIKFIKGEFAKTVPELESNPVFADNYATDFAKSVKYCEELLEALDKNDYEIARDKLYNSKPSRISPFPKDQKTELSEYYQKLRRKLHDKINEARGNFLPVDAETSSTLFNTYASMCEIIHGVLSKFDEEYNAEKKRRGVCEFSDMPRYMLTLLIDENGNYTEYAKTLRDQFVGVYIDEYQDVNAIQDKIFSIIGGDHRFMVGDIKQSIYSFREADPSIFSEYRANLPLYDEKNDSLPASGSGSSIFMSENFRCDRNVVDFANTVCSKIFGTFSESIEYTSADDLKFSQPTPYEGYKSQNIVLNIIQTPEKKEDADNDTFEDNIPDSDDCEDISDEAIVTANAIADLIRTRHDNKKDNISAGDITVLTRGNNHPKPLMRALRKLNIKYNTSNKDALYESVDMKLLLDLLCVIDNPRSDMPLSNVLTASTDKYESELSIEDVITVRKFADKDDDRSRSLYDAIIFYSENGDKTDLAKRCEDFVDRIEKIRDESRKLSADKLIKNLASYPKYSELANTDEYNYIYDSACRCVKNMWSSLYSFISYFKRFLEKGEGASEPVAHFPDSVRIMSIHQSKGLEFRVCFLYGFGKQLNLTNRCPIVFDKDIGVLMHLPPIHREETSCFDRIRTRYAENPVHKSVAHYIKLKQIEEEIRILYVALTRASQRLYISATVSDKYDNYLARFLDESNTEYYIRKVKRFLDWITIALHTSGNKFSNLDLNIFDKGQNLLTKALTSAELNSSVEITEDDKDYARILASPISSGKLSAISEIPSKVAASKVKRNMLDQSIFTSIPSGKLFTEDDDGDDSADGDTEKLIKKRIELMKSEKNTFDSLLAINKKPTSAEIGSAIHAFLQFCEFKDVSTPEGIFAEIERLKNERFITDRTASIIKTHQPSGFFESNIYKSALEAKEVHREFRFGMFRNASEFTQNDELKETLSDKKIFVQGSIDLIIEKQNGDIILCDYKTDHISREERENRALLLDNMREKHGEQLNQYRYAIEQIFERSPAHIYLYLLAINEEIEL